MPESTVAQATSEAPVTREEGRFLVPPVDIYENNEGLVVVVDLPGVKKEDTKIRVERNVLTIEGHVSDSIMGQPEYSEFRLLDFFRQFNLSDEVDQERISADMKHGVLTLILPRKEAVKPKQIAINVA